jgi:hypothetical protein
LFIDSDALPGPRWLPAAVERLENGADAVVGPSMYRNGRWKPGSALMLAAALPSWGFVLARTSMPGKPSPASLLSHNLAIRRELFLRHPFNTTKRSFCSSLLFFELARSGARIVFEPDQRVAHAMTFRWWSLTRHFRAGWETYQGRELDRDWPRMPSLERLKLLEPAVLRMGVACHDLRHWFRYSRVLGIHPARRIVLFPLVAAASFTARTCEMAGMYAALFAPKATERQARF